MRWFLPSSSALPVWKTNDVRAYRTAEGLWQAMKEALDPPLPRAILPGQFIYFVGLALDLDFKMAPGTTMGQLLTAADADGVQIRAMYQHYKWAPNAAAVAFINKLANGAAILEPGGSGNHQKVMVVGGGRHPVGFCGGVDIHPDRRSWHDVHVRVTGPAAQGLHRVVYERWTSNPKLGALAGPKQAMIQPGFTTDGPGDKHVQVVRTYPRAKGGGRSYAFALDGEHTIYDLIRNAIAQTSEFIYLEDQYLTQNRPMRIGPPVSALLAEKLAKPGFKQLVILFARTEPLNAGTDPELHHQGWYRRRKFIEELRAAAPAKVAICQYKGDASERTSYENPKPFVHSKTWVFDDRFAITGSANCDRRGYTSNSEADVGIADRNAAGDRPFFAHSLRMDLWLRHLNPADPANKIFHEKDVADPLQAAKYWTSPHPSSPIERYDTRGDKRLKPPNEDAADTLGPDPDADWDAQDPDDS